MILKKLELGDLLLPREMRAIPNVSYDKLGELTRAVVTLRDMAKTPKSRQLFVMAYVDETSNSLAFVESMSPLAVRRHAFKEACCSTNTVAVYVLDADGNVNRLSFWEHWCGRAPDEEGDVKE